MSSVCKLAMGNCGLLTTSCDSEICHCRADSEMPHEGDSEQQSHGCISPPPDLVEEMPSSSDESYGSDHELSEAEPSKNSHKQHKSLHMHFHQSLGQQRADNAAYSVAIFCHSRQTYSTFLASTCA